MLTQALQQQLQAFRQQHPELQVPPPIFAEMEAEVVAYDAEAQLLRIRMPVQARFQNPMGAMQGGMIAAAVDNALGPLSFLVAPPSVTAQLNVTYLRPITAASAFLEVEAGVTAHAGRQLLLTAQVFDAEGRLAAVAQATNTVLRPAQQ